MRVSLIFCLIFWTAGLLYAQEEEINMSSDRPGQCYSAVTVDKGYLLLETGLGLDLMNGMDNWGLAVRDFRYGIVKNFELKTGIRSTLTKFHGIDETMLNGSLMAGLKWGIVNKKVQLAYVAEAYIPLHPNIVTAQHSLNMAHSVGDKVGFSYMFLHNYDFSQLRNRRYFGGLQFSYLASFSLHKKWSFYVGLSGMWDSSSRREYQVLYDAGLIYMIKDNLQIDLFFGHGINYKHGNYGIGLCWMPKKGKKEKPVIPAE